MLDEYPVASIVAERAAAAERAATINRCTRPAETAADPTFVGRNERATS
jgi:hypothetical protein